MMPWRPVVARLSPAGPRARLTILIFHRVVDTPDPIYPGEPVPARFDTLVRHMARWFRVLPLDEAVAMLAQGRLPDRAAVITFDDGYADNFTLAMPILRRHGVSATFFIATGFLDGGRMWNDTVVETVRGSRSPELDLDALGLGRHKVATPEDKRAAVGTLLEAVKYCPLDERLRLTEEIARLAGVTPPADLMMSTDQVRQMAVAGMQIGAHTQSHPILARLDAGEAEREIAGSKRTLEDIVGRRVSLFAYPNGRPGRDYEEKDVEIVRRLGFEAAVSTRPAAARGTDNPFELPRFTPWDRSMLMFGARLARNLAGA